MSTKDTMDRVVVRRATVWDYDAVMSIRKDVYEGIDTLPDQYIKNMADPTKHAVVALLDGEIVAFHIAHIVDNGRTAVMQSGRTSTKIQGIGIQRMMKQRHYTDILFPIFPGIARQRSMSIDTDYWDAKKNGTEITMRRVIISLGGVPVPFVDFVRRLTPQRMAALRQQLPIDSLSPANANILNDILADPVSKEHLFPEGIMVRDNEVFDANTSNTYMATKGCSAIFVRRSASSKYESLSFGIGPACRLGCRYTIDYYGTRDLSVILAHVSRHLPLVREISRQRPILVHLIVQEEWLGKELRQGINEFSAANIASTGECPRYFKIYTMNHPLPVPNPRL